MKIVIDFETYFDSKAKYSLKNISMVEYIRDSRFKVFGFGFQRLTEEGHAEPGWINEKSIKQFLFDVDWSETDIVAHNCKFDGFILSERYGIKPRSWIDTKGMARAVLGKKVRDCSLATLAEYYGLQSKGVMKTDGLQTLSAEQEKELSEYCLHDVELCSDVYRKLTETFPENQYEVLHQTIRMFVEPKLELDTELLIKASNEEKEKKKNIFSDLRIDKKVFSSNVQFAELLSKEKFQVPLKLSPRKKDEIGNPAKIPALALGDIDFLEMLNNGNDRLKTLCEARVVAKSTLLETRSEKLANIGKTGAWPFDVEYSGAKQTHRFSGGGGAGGNPQNFTRGSILRKAIKAPKGYKLIVGDFTAVEFRLVAYLSRDPNLIYLIENDIDPYCQFASIYYGRTITKKDEEERRFVKEAQLGLGYGMGWKKFKNRVKIKLGKDISDEEAKRAVYLYRNTYKKVPQLWEILNQLIPILKTGQIGRLHTLPIKYKQEALVLPSGLEIQYPSLKQIPGEEHMEWVYEAWSKNRSQKEIVRLYGGKILENVSQALAGELTKETSRRFRDKVVGSVHDEIHLLETEELAKETAMELEQVMSTAPNWMKELKLKAEVGIGNNWLEAK